MKNKLILRILGLWALTLFVPLSANAEAGASGCEIGGFVIDADPSGLNVRELPSAKSKKLGVLQPPLTTEDGIPAHIEVEIRASKNGWFKIRNARDNSALNTGKQRKPYSGEGWVSGQGLAVKSQSRQAYEKPSKGSKVLLATDMPEWDSIQGAPKLLDCQGKWARIEIETEQRKVRAWVNQICDIQETSCSGLGEE